ncbi:MAG: GGDEF domain-containing protein [Gammaproteobacteria bacterium]|nr:GGDEF domain-containing protein [Gammaproteobacteria bacterium]
MINDNIHSLISPELEKVLKSCTHLPSLPAVALRIIEASKDPDISLHEVAAIISSDPAITVKLLKVANSPLYSQRRSLNNLREALTLLGFNASLTIALSFSLLQSLGSDSDHESYWKRSILAASIARLLGERLHVSKLEDLFLASLLQDIGVLVIQCIKNSPYPHNEHHYLKHSERAKLEQDFLGVEHSVVGAWLLSSWKLPGYLVKAVLNSHSLNMSDPALNTVNSYFHYCLNLSGNLADIWLDENPSELLLSVLNVTKKVLVYDETEFNQLIVDIDNALPEISNMFQISLVGDYEREKVLNEARELLLERSISAIKQSEDARRYIESITDRVEQIEKSSRIDHLTKVYNRQHIDKLLETEFEEANINRWPLSLAFIDIDDFKVINDTFGHLVGDEILKLISDFFSKNIRETDILARYGGDEFLLMLPGSTSDITKTVLERLLKLYIDEVILDVKDIKISASVSIGIATHMDKHNFDNLKDFMTAADEALYKAKAGGKNCLSIY